MNISDLKVEEPYQSLFQIEDHVLSAIQEDMEKNGYDQSKPIIIWADRNIVIDGHTRLKAAQNIGRKTVPVHELDFDTPTDALKYALHHQRARRNLDDAQKFYLVEKLDKIRNRGGDRRSKFANAKVDYYSPDTVVYQSSRDITAKLIGISADKVSKCRHILHNCSDKEINAVRNGKISVHRAWKNSLSAEKVEERKLKKQDSDRKIIEELRVKDFHSIWSLVFVTVYHARLVEMIDKLVLKLLPNLDKLKSEMYEIRNIVEAYELHEEIFKIFCNRLPVQRFLGSLFVHDFIEILRLFGYKILTPSSLKVIKEKRIDPIKKRRQVPPSYANIGRVHEVDFKDDKKDKAIFDSMARAVKRDIEEGRIKVDE